MSHWITILLKKLSDINYTRIPYTGQMCTIEPDLSVYTLLSTWVSDRSTNPNTSYFTAAAWTNVALKSHGSVCEENAGTTSSSKPCTKAFDGRLTTSSYWTTTAPGAGSWLKVRETERVDQNHEIVCDTQINMMTSDGLTSDVPRTLAATGFTSYNEDVLAFI